MKAFLLHRDRDFEWDRELPSNEDALTQDLELNMLFSAMAAGDSLLREVARCVVLISLSDPEAIVYRQEILTDCLKNPTVARELYDVAGEALAAEKSVWGGLGRDAPRSMLSTSVQKLELLIASLRRVRQLRDEHAGAFGSSGFTRFFTMIGEELGEDYMELLDGHVKELKFKSGMLLSAQLTTGNKGRNYTLRRPRAQRLLQRMLDRSGYTFTIPERDESGFRALGALEDRGVNLVANALRQSVEHVRSFFAILRAEIGFYVACLNLSERLDERHQATCLPVAIPRREIALSATSLYDVCLTLTTDQPVVANDIGADGKSLVVITGANQGGKSTFLRSVGLAQLMMQCGMFVGAESFRANVSDGIFTHYKREEDEAMESGKLDEELARMSAIADHLRSNSMLLCNESFAATNEREGSQIARQVIRALLDDGVRVLFVTHMYDLAHSFFSQEDRDAYLFLRAERGTGGARSFKLATGEPLPTSYGEDSYRKIFGKSADPGSSARSDIGPT